MNNQTPYWHDLILHWMDVERRDGLTIPFILGAKKEIDKEYKYEENEVEKLFTEIINYEDDNYIVTLAYCDRIGEKVLSLFKRIQEKYYQGKPFKNPKTHKVSMFIGNGSHLGETVAEISHRLQEEYQDKILKNEFSYINCTWQNYTTKEQEMIRNVLKL